MASSYSSSALKIVAEYAKSGRSSCKQCAKTIANKAVRLGLVSKDPRRGHDVTKWHHLECFPLKSKSNVSPESIKGFSLLESKDQEELKLLMNAATKKELKVTERDYDLHDEPAEKCVKKQKVSDSDEEGKPEIAFSASDVKDKYKSKDQEELKLIMNAATKKELKVTKRDYDLHDEPAEKCVKKQKVSDSDEEGKPEIAFSASDVKDKYKSKDQEELKLIMNAATKKELKVTKRDYDLHDEPAEKCVKKQKVSDSDEEGKPEIAFSASDVKDKYKDAALSPPWKAFQTIIFLERVDGLHDSRKIAAFDFDGCLANTSVKRTGADAWSLMFPTIPEKLQKLYKDGFKLVIFTNESNIERWKNKRQAAVDSKIGRLNNFIKRVDVPIQVFIACGLSSGKPEDPYRKPESGMWHIMEKYFNSDLQIDMDCSFYVGDAAGRLKDHSDADIKFAQAIGLKFHVPEEYFGKGKGKRKQGERNEIPLN